MENNKIFDKTNIEELTQSEIIKNLQHKTNNIRNICVLAHVDHGKTSLVDSLISYNNIINPRLAGDIRYMDSRPDEQERCITMKSSSISITYNSEAFKDDYLINLIDSPGHVDFSSEIFSALKICDGALILIDVVEGICSQTESVIKQAWDEKIKCVLVLNKIDRLITEVQLEPLEAYNHINNLLEKANSLIGSLIVRDINMKTEINANRKTSGGDNLEINVDDLIEEKEKEIYFSPDKGNVIFTSALDCWGFNLNTFSDILSKKIGFKREAIKKLLWGDYYFNHKTKKVYTEKVNQNSKPMFVEFVLDNIYKLYKMILTEKNSEKILKAATTLNTIITDKDLNSLEKNPRNLLKIIVRQWLPIPKTVFDVIIEHLPNPIKGFQNKLDVLFPHYKLNYNDYTFLNKLKEYFKLMETNTLTEENKKNYEKEIPTIAFVSKMVPIPRKNIAGEEYKGKDKDDVKFMAFARNFFGKFKKGQEYYVIGPKHQPKINIYDIHKFKFDNLYFFMGQYLELLEEVPVGNIFSLDCLENYVYKTATISSIFDSPSITPNNINKNSIIKVSIIPEDIKEMSAMIEGLKKLNKSDPAVDYYIQSNGEHILATAGEVHLERCIKDLEDHLAKVKLKVFTPIVNFKEGLANTMYNPRKNVIKKKKDIIEEDKETSEIKEKGKRYNFIIIEPGEENIDIDDQKEILKSSMPMILKKEPKYKKPEKEVKHKIKDIKNKTEKTNFYIEKINIEKDNKGYAEDVTPNQMCKISVSAVGMKREMIDLIESNENLLKEVNTRNFVLSKDLYENFNKFKTDLLNTISDNKRLRTLIENNLISFGMNNYEPNMLIIKNISNKYNYFSKIVYEEAENKIEEHPLDSVISTTDNTNNTKSDLIIIEEEKTNSNKGSNSKQSHSNKASYKQKIFNSDSKKTKFKDESNTITTIDEEISNILKEESPREFLNSVKSGYELAINAGPLCEENMYGVFFIFEDIKLNKANKTEVSIKNEISEETKPDNITIVADELKKDLITQNELVEETKSSDVKSVSSKQYNLYGPFLGQVIGTVKDCCRKAYLNGEPRLYEPVYLCIFQIRQEHIGKIHSVINKRRGKIINELSNDEAIICTIEAKIPVIESFGFVEEIRKKSSGMANPMLQFYQWEMIDIDPFYVPTTEEEIENFGTNIDAPNIAKNYINKIRIRKGLPIDEKIIKSSDKQKNLSKKR